MSANWQKLASAKREGVLSLIPPAWRISNVPSAKEQRDVTGSYIQQFLTEQEIEITETDLVGIASRTTSGKWKSVDVTRAFCHRAALAHQLTNCLHEIFFDIAMESAVKLDEYYATNKQPLGPLHGVPISLKDQFHVKGVETSMGYVGWLGTFEGQKGTGKEKVFESELVVELLALGAVLYCKSSVPHTLMTGETINNIIGYCWNPKNRYLSSGGSSGGEGALIGCRGSPCGFGTDIGGSIRIPAAFNGLYGLRPSSGRIPYEGMANSMDGQNSLLSVVGPLATSVEALRLITKAVLSTRPWLHDPLVVELPWRPSQEQDITDIVGSPRQGAKGGILAFGVMAHDGSITPHPPVRRAIDMVVKCLQGLDHKMVDWKPPSHKKIHLIAQTTWAFDGGADIHKAFSLSGEPLSPQIASYGTEPQREMTASQIAATNVAKRQMQKEYMEYWNSTEQLTGTGRPVDALICPVAPFAAARPEKFTYYGYSNWVNAVDYTSVVIPVTTVDKDIDRVDTNFEPLDEADKNNFENYDPEIYHGAHVAIQIVGRRFTEEKTLALAAYVAEALKGMQ